MPVSSVRDSFDPNVDKHVLELAWRHLQIVHEFGPYYKVLIYAPEYYVGACTSFGLYSNTQMKNESYEVGFIRSATRVSAAKGVWWKGWLKKEDETYEHSSLSETLDFSNLKLCTKNHRLGFNSQNGRYYMRYGLPLACYMFLDRRGANWNFWQDLFKAIKKARKELCNDFLGRVVTSCLCNKKSYCAACAVAMLKENYKNEQFRCPCCRQDPAYFIAIDWIFINNPDEQKRRRALSKKQREIRKKQRLREAKCQAQELAKDQLEEGELRE
ncbi:hypothetical protein DFJ43DRAFT_1044769 [Lentinula guzmanii]|uniref:Uncharacterized protein n=1 Tax=Lentinula guzmanii TaxID=2804957 RepID=A0AA38MU28_9AGAR|nr:hypothetical protein DFJ43DRAFT_1044769 [Lentinula guzmanii]